MSVLAYQYGLWKLGVPGIVILVLFGGLSLYRRKGGNRAVGIALLLALTVIAGAIALADGYAIFGGGLLALGVVLLVAFGIGALRGGSAGPPQAPSTQA